MSATKRVADVVVIGAGPAGLSAAAALARDLDVVVLEAGGLARRRDDARDVLSGVGGAGLFSDGKHSFYPSASALWRLDGPDRVSAAFAGTAAFLATYGVDAGPDPSCSPADPEPSPGTWHPKPYPSVYADLATRRRMIDDLWRASGDARAGVGVVEAGRSGDELVLGTAGPGGPGEVRARALIVATGRWSATWTREWLGELGVRFAFGRTEVGVRLEAGADAPVFARLPGLDGKLRMLAPDLGVEIRTFCTCRDGEVLLGESNGRRAWSGRADGARTGRSNVGLLVRTADPAMGADLLARVWREEPAQMPLREWRRVGPTAVERWFGPKGATALTAAVERFAGWAGELGDARVYLPVVEGVGAAPRDDGALGVAPSVWVAGDVGGRFRGIVAAMVSGRYAADRCLG